MDVFKHFSEARIENGIKDVPNLIEIYVKNYFICYYFIIFANKQILKLKTKTLINFLESDKLCYFFTE